MKTMTFTLASARASHHSRREEGGRTHEQVGEHKSVMVEEALRALDLHSGELVVDATAGQGGHSVAILGRVRDVRLLALDADPQAVEATRARLALLRTHAEVVEANFGDLDAVLRKRGLATVDKVLFDLGWSSAQLTAGRGFSFAHDEPLSMSYGRTPASGFTARQALNEWDEKTLADVFFGYGDERYAKRIAKAIVERRAIAPIETTIEFAELIRDTVPPAYRHGRLHPATRTFQALRIAVNDELGVIERGFTAAWEHLASGGRIVAITFHSIEDRAVKQLFSTLSKKNGRLVYKKPLVPTQAEITRNPRARSAKLRAIEKI